MPIWEAPKSLNSMHSLAHHVALYKFTLYCLACENDNVYILELRPVNVRVWQKVADLIQLKQVQPAIRDLSCYDNSCSNLDYRVLPANQNEVRTNKVRVHRLGWNGDSFVANLTKIVSIFHY